MSRSTMFCFVLTILSVWNSAGCLPNTQTPATTEHGTLPTQATAAADNADFGETVTLGTTVTNTAGGEVSYSWIQTAGPGVRLQNAGAAEASFVAPSLQTEQTLRFQVTTRNDNGDIGSANVEIVVAADPNFGQRGDTNGGNGGGSESSRPRARAGLDQQPEAGALVTLDGSSSTGAGLTFRWRQTSGPRVTLSATNSAVVTFTAPAFIEGGVNTLEFELLVTDVQQRTAADRIKIVVQEATDGGGTPAAARVRITTTMGAFTIELDAVKAPNSARNFLQYVDDKFYDGTLMHRVIPGFVVQGGGYLPGLTPKETRDPVNSEANNGLKNLRGTVAMARTNDPNSATSQFYVNLVDNSSLDFSSTNPGYTVFGRVVEGLDIIDQIATVPTTSKGGLTDVPVTDVIIQKAERLPSSP